MKPFLQRILQEIMKRILGTSDAWSAIHLSQQTSESAYYIVDWRILWRDSSRLLPGLLEYDIFKHLKVIFPALSCETTTIKLDFEFHILLRGNFCILVRGGIHICWTPKVIIDVLTWLNTINFVTKDKKRSSFQLFFF